MITSPVVARPVPPWVMTTTLAAVSLVAAVAAVASYAHILRVAEAAGEQWRAVLTPLSVDGLLVAASMVMYTRRRAGQPAGWLCWSGLTAGLGASVFANIAASEQALLAAMPSWLAWGVAAWPAVALAVAFELLIMVARDRAAAADAGLDVDGESYEQRRDRLLSENAGRRAVARQLGITEHEARQLITQHTNGREPVA